MEGEWKWSSGRVCYSLPRWNADRCATYRIQGNNALMSRDGKMFEQTLGKRLRATATGRRFTRADACGLTRIRASNRGAADERVPLYGNGRSGHPQMVVHRPLRHEVTREKPIC